METRKVVLCFLNWLDFIERVNGHLVEVMSCMKQRLDFEFEDYIVATMINALEIIDEMVVLIITNELNALLEKNNTLRETIYYF